MVKASESYVKARSCWTSYLSLAMLSMIDLPSAHLSPSLHATTVRWTSSMAPVCYVQTFSSTRKLDETYEYDWPPVSRRDVGKGGLVSGIVARFILVSLCCYTCAWSTHELEDRVPLLVQSW